MGTEADEILGIDEEEAKKLDEEPQAEEVEAKAEDEKPEESQAEEVEAKADDEEPEEKAAAESDEVDYKELWSQEQARTQRLEDQNAGLLRTVQNYRGRDDAPQRSDPEPSKLEESPRAEVKYGEDGTPFVELPASEPTIVDRQTQAVQTVRDYRNNTVLRDPVHNAEPVNKLFEAYATFDNAMKERAQATGVQPFTNAEEALAFAEQHSIDKAMRNAYGGMLPSTEAFEDFVEAAYELSPRKWNRLVENQKQSVVAKDEPSGEDRTEKAAEALDEKPRSQAERGEKSDRPKTKKDRLAELELKDPISWSDKEFEEYSSLVEAS